MTKRSKDIRKNIIIPLYDLTSEAPTRKIFDSNDSNQKKLEFESSRIKAPPNIYLVNMIKNYYKKCLISERFNFEDG